MAPIARVEREGREVAVVEGTDVAVEEIVHEDAENRYAPDDIAAKYPDLSTEDVEEALRYYREHRGEFDG